jgi:hypothetical protein
MVPNAGVGHRFVHYIRCLSDAQEKTCERLASTEESNEPSDCAQNVIECKFLLAKPACNFSSDLVSADRTLQQHPLDLPSENRDWGLLPNVRRPPAK